MVGFGYAEGVHVSEYWRLLYVSVLGSIWPWESIIHLGFMIMYNYFTLNARNGLVWSGAQRILLRRSADLTQYGHYKLS